MDRKTKKVNNHYVVDEIINHDENGYTGETIWNSLINMPRFEWLRHAFYCII